MTTKKPKLRIVRYSAWTFCTTGILWMGWLAVRIDVNENVHDDIRTVPVVGNDLEELRPFGSVYAIFRTHPHGNVSGILCGHCSEAAFREIEKNWEMQPLEMDVEMSTHFLKMVPEDHRLGIIPSDSDIGGIHGSRIIGNRQVRMRGAYFRKGQGYILKVQSST